MTRLSLRLRLTLLLACCWNMCVCADKAMYSLRRSCTISSRCQQLLAVLQVGIWQGCCALAGVLGKILKPAASRYNPGQHDKAWAACGSFTPCAAVAKATAMSCKLLVSCVGVRGTSEHWAVTAGCHGRCAVLIIQHRFTRSTQPGRQGYLGVLSLLTCGWHPCLPPHPHAYFWCQLSGCPGVACRAHAWDLQLLTQGLQDEQLNLQ